MEGVEQSQCAAGSGARAGVSLTTGSGLVLGICAALAAGLALRLLMLQRLFEVNGDSLIYGGLGKNLLLYGRYALPAPNGVLYPTLIRLPGYPLFLAACFRIFGMENYWAAACVAIVLELAGCLLLADFTRLAARAVRGADRTFACRAALATLWLAALCPFTASYAALPLAEAPTLFTLALAMDAMARFCARPRWASALAFTVAVTGTALLRPDGVLAAIAFAPAMLMALPGAPGGKAVLSPALRASSFRVFSRETAAGPKPAPATGPASPRLMAMVCILIALAPFAAWTWRNWRVFHVFQPLAPRLATDPGESTNPGWERWVKTWCLDFISTYEIYWPVPDGPLDIGQLPGRAFDSPAQYVQTAALAREYERNDEQLTPSIDDGFARLAAERVAAHPLRYYLWLPLGRVADMWLRPRVDNLNIDVDWWVYSHHRAETRFSWLYAALNAFYLLLAGVGLCFRPDYWKALLGYMLLRSALLLTVTAPETRYTLECFPMLFALGGVALAAGWRKVFREAKER